MTTWLTDNNGNRASVEYWGSEKAAQEALNSLTNCSGCSGCSDLKEATPTTGTFKHPPTPVIDRIHSRLLEAVSQPNALNMSNWHTCKTTHCRAGLIVTLAGEEGKALEEFHSTLQAAMMIYDASDPQYKINPCRFFDSNEEAMADIKKCAETEQARL